MSEQVKHRKLYEYIIQLGIRLKAKSLTIGYAVIYCYKVIERNFPKQLCLHTMATSCVLLAGKVTNDPKITTRDVINISYRLLHPNKTALEIGDLSYAIREGLIEMELVTLRFLRFRFNFEHPHQDVILMLAVLRDWFPLEFGQNPDLDKVAAMFLQDIYVLPELIIDHRPKTIAVLVISMAFDALNLKVQDESWVPIFNESLDATKLIRLKQKVTEEVYRV